MVSILCFGLKIRIFVLLVVKLILFALNHCTTRAKSWIRNLFTLPMYLSIVGWYHLQNDVVYLMLLTNLNHHKLQTFGEVHEWFLGSLNLFLLHLCIVFCLLGMNEANNWHYLLYHSVPVFLVECCSLLCQKLFLDQGIPHRSRGLYHFLLKVGLNPN